VGFAGSFTKGDVQSCEFCDVNSSTVDHDQYFLSKNWWSLESMAHACNPSFSGGRDQEDHGSKPAWANIMGDPVLKIPITKRAAGSGSR
jgi:hypothetical protein